MHIRHRLCLASCAYYAHPLWSIVIKAGRAESFTRRSTGEITLERAKAVTRLRLETENLRTTLPVEAGTTIKDAIAAFIADTADGGARKSTLTKYGTLMNQLQAFVDWKGLRYLRELDQKATIEFRRAWEDENAGYKRGVEKRPGLPRWRSNSIGTCKRSAKTLKYFYEYGISRKWITENPAHVLRFPKASAAKTKAEVKYLMPQQLQSVLCACDRLTHMTDYNRQRLKALILTLRWTGLRLGDAVVLTEDSIFGDVLRIRTKKASTDVQIPLHPDLVAALTELQPQDGYLFWNKRTESSKPSTPQLNFGVLLTKVFRSAGVKFDTHHIAHALRNTFAVDLLEKGLPLETLSLMLGHQSVRTTELYYADFSKGYMDRAEARVRTIWLLGEGETLT